MKTRIPFLLSVLVMLCGAKAFAAAGTSQTTWTNPVQYVDGSTLPSSDISGYKFLCTFTPTGASTGVPCSGLTPAQINTGAQSTVSLSFTYPPAGGVACFQVVATAAGSDSDPSANTAQSCKTFAALKPRPPSGVTITVTISANLPKGVTINTLIAESKAFR